MMRPEPECPDRSVLADLLDGRLPPDVLESAGAHVESCGRCCQLLGEMEKSSTRHRVRDIRSSTPLEKAVLPLLTGMLEPCAVPGALGKLGVFVVMEVLDRGGMGIVLRGEDPSLKREVAIKLLSPELAAAAESRGRFLREAQTAAAIDHENVIPIFAVSEDGPLPWLVMPYNNGGSLQQRLEREGRLPWPEAVRIGEAVAAGLAAAHDRGVLHRDIKPANILLSQEGKVRIADFGLARAADASLLTRSGVLSGTPAYMAPEQIDGADADARADLFSLGVLLYRMVSERGPFEAPNATATIKKVAFDDPPPLRRQPDPPPDWYCQLVHSLLEKKPENRPADAAAVGAALRMKSVRKPGGRAAMVRVIAALLTVIVLVGALVHALSRPRGAGGDGPSPEADLRSAAERMRAGKPADRIAFLVNAVRQGGETRQTASRALLYDLAWTPPPAAFPAGGPAGPRVLDVGMDLEDVAYGSDGGDVFGVSPDGRYSVWSARGGALLIGRFYWPARARVISAGKTLTAFYLERGEIYFLNHHTFFLQTIRLDQTGALRCAALSPDDSLTLTGGGDGTVKLWENSTGRTTHEWVHPGGGAVTRLVFTLDGRTGVSASEDGTVLVLDLATGLQRGAPLTHGGAVQWLALSPDMTRVASGATDGTARVWSLTDGTACTPPLVHAGTCGPEGIHGAFITDERLATGGTDNGQVILRDARTGEAVAEPLSHAATVTTLTYADGMLAAGAADGSVRLWDALRGEPLSPELRHEGPVRRIRFAPNAPQMLVAGRRGAWLYDLAPPVFELPDWFLDLAEKLAGRQINERGVLVDIPKPSVAELAADIPENAEPAGAMVGRFARWLVAAPDARAVVPFSVPAAPVTDGMREQIIRVMLEQLERPEDKSGGGK